MKLLILTNDFPPMSGGMAQYSYGIAKGLTELGEEIIVLVPQIKGDLEFDRKQKFKIIRMGVPRTYTGKIIVMFFYLSYIFVRYRVKRILATTWSPCGFVAFLFSRLFKTPYFVSAHGLDILEPQRSPKYTKLMRRTLNGAVKILPNSNFTKSKLIEFGISGKRIIVIPDGTDPIRFNPNIDSSEIKERFHLQDKKVILTVGRLMERKGHDMVIQSLPQVLERIPSIVYLIAGKGPEEKRLKKLVKDLDLEEKIIFAGFVSDENLPKYYSACNLFIMPSREMKEEGDVEGFGIVYLEANACGKPVIGGRSGGVEDAIIDGVTGLLVDPSSKGEISQSLIRLLKDEKLVIQLGKNGRKRVERELNWENITERIRNEIV